MGSDVNRPEVQRAALPLTELTTIVCGIAATVAIASLLSLIKQSEDPGRHFPLNAILLSIICIVTIVRFYLGNFRHLDEQYFGGHGKSYSKQSRSPVGRRLAADFLVIIVQSLLTVGLANSLDSPIQFVFVYSTLLLVDAFWFFFFHDIDSDRAKYWALNNLGFGFAFLVGGLVLIMTQLTVGELQLATGIFAFLALLNTGLDIHNEFDFYFPSFKPSREVFLAAPFTGEVDADGVFNKPLQDDLQKIIEYFRNKRYTVRSAHEREKFGSDLYPAAKALEGDLTWLEGCGVVVAIMKGTPSPGVQMELGAALVLGKPVIQIILPDASVPYLNRAFEQAEFGRGRNFHVIRGNISTVLDELGTKVDKLCKAD